MLNDKKVSPLIEDQFDLVVEAARLRKIVAADDTDVSYILGQLAHPHPYVARAAIAALAAVWPQASLPERWGGETPTDLFAGTAALPDWLIKGCGEWQTKGIVVRRVLAVFDRLDLSGQELFLERLAGLTGLSELLVKELAIIRPNLAQALQSQLAQFMKGRFPDQVNFAPTMSCQLNCPYCISADPKVQSPGEANQETVLALLDWAQRSGIRRLGLAGGEPTLYGHFTWMLSEFTRRNMEFFMATNGLFGPEKKKEIIAARPATVSLHLTPQVRSSPQLETFAQTAKEMTQNGLLVVLRINLTKPDEDIPFYFSLAKNTGIQEIRAAVPMPNVALSNLFVKLDKLQSFSGTITRLFNEGRHQGIKVILAKPFPLCTLPKATAQDLLASESMAINCPVHLSEFTNNLVVWPDLSYSPCLGLNFLIKRPIIETKNPAEAAQVYREQVFKLLKTPLMEPCLTCPLGQGGRCTGACLSYRQSVT